MARGGKRFFDTAVLALTVFLVLGAPVCLAAAEQGAAARPAGFGDTGAIALAAALVVGVACIGGGIAVGRVGAAALGAASERPELLMRSLILIGLAEGIAIYGLIISFLILNR